MAVHRVNGYQCPTCKTIVTAVMANDEMLTAPVDIALRSGQGVMWCVNGHVTVFNDGRWQQVYDFDIGHVAPEDK